MIQPGLKCGVFSQWCVTQSLLLATSHCCGINFTF